MAEPLDVLAAHDPLAGRREPPVATDAPATARYALLDVFTDVALAGNQLAVFMDARAIEPDWMQPLARELKLSETVFVLPARERGDVAIRIFTPAVELPFAGHPVLGTAILLGGALGLESVTVETLSGPVDVRVRSEDGVAVSGWMDQPVPTWQPFQEESRLLRALGVERSGLPVEVYDNGPHHVCVELEEAAAVAALRPDLHALGELGPFCVSCFAGSGRHWTTRMFAPGLGVAEDPATGSAAGPLAVHLSRHGRIAFGAEVEIRQGAEIGRPSLLYAFAEGTAGSIERVAVGGSAVIVGRGDLALPLVG
jgi:trans-2,3-dihydro-3-hydroxyanthranilate isomerase